MPTLCDSPTLKKKKERKKKGKTWGPNEEVCGSDTPAAGRKGREINKGWIRSLLDIITVVNYPLAYWKF